MSCSKSKLVQQCMDLAEVIRDLKSCSGQECFDPGQLKQMTPKLVSVVAAMRGESNTLPVHCGHIVEACEALKQCAVKFLQQLKSPSSTPNEVSAGIIEIAVKLKDVADKIKELPDNPSPSLPISPPGSPSLPKNKPYIPHTQPMPMPVAPHTLHKVMTKTQTPPSPVSKSFLTSSGSNSSPPSSPSRSFMDFPIPVRQIMNQREEVKSTLTALVQAHKELNSALCKEVEEKLVAQINNILSPGKTAGCDMTPTILPIVEKLCNFSENVGYSQDLVAVMSELNLALKDLGQTFKTYNKERAKSGAHVAVPMPIGVTPSSSHSGNVQILVNELKGLVQDGDPLDKYNLLKKVGEGASGSVWKAETKAHPSDTVAIKKVELSVKTIEGTLKEIRFMSDIHHPNALEYRECWLPKGEVWIVMEFCDGGSVSDILEKLAKPLEERCISAITAQTLCGLEYLHSKQKIHRDIKAANLLLTIQGRVKIADFGTSAEGSARTTVVGTFMWMAPETIDARGHDSKADIWSLGITLVEMAELYPPYWHLRTQPRQVAQAILREPSPTLQQPSLWSPEFVEVVNLCLQKDPTRRPTANMLSKHPFLANPDPSCILDLLNQANLAQKQVAPQHQPQQQARPQIMPHAQQEAHPLPLKTPHLMFAEKSMNRPSKTLPRQSKYRPGTGQGQPTDTTGNSLPAISGAVPGSSPRKEIPVSVVLAQSDVVRRIAINSSTTASQLALKCTSEFQDLVTESQSQNFCLYFIGVTTNIGSEFKVPEHGIIWNILQAIWTKNPEAEAKFVWK